MVPRETDLHRYDSEFLSNAPYQNNLKHIKDLNIKPETLKLLEENICKTLQVVSKHRQEGTEVDSSSTDNYHNILPTG